MGVDICMVYSIMVRGKYLLDYNIDVLYNNDRYWFCGDDYCRTYVHMFIVHMIYQKVSDMYIVCLHAMLEKISREQLEVSFAELKACSRDGYTFRNSEFNLLCYNTVRQCVVLKKL